MTAIRKEQAHKETNRWNLDFEGQMGKEGGNPGEEQKGEGTGWVSISARKICPGMVYDFYISRSLSFDNTRLLTTTVIVLGETRGELFMLWFDFRS
jgi:hypothetical protein